ncbi:GntR family transcriptional regulator [Actinoallomurus sp. CA-150999]|uniref:GntR family transcriptional regulator n=1 Tax=Actinoallomurus sp. CA-150999 TaxID=3239887 RepID=UPI003D8FBE5A
MTEELKGRIRSGELEPGTELATEFDLAAQHDLDVQSIRLVLADLANLGLIEHSPGRPIRVREFPAFTLYASREKPGRGPENSDSYHTDVALQGRLAGHQVYVTKDTAKAEVARRLRIPEGSAVVFRQMWRQIDGEHWSVETSYYPLDLVKDTDLMKPEDIKRGTIEVLAEKGHRQVGYTDRVTAREPTLEEAEYFGLDPSTRPAIPVIEHWRTAYSVQRPIRVTHTILPADRNHLLYETGDVSAYHAEEIFPGSDHD